MGSGIGGMGSGMPIPTLSNPLGMPIPRGLERVGEGWYGHTATHTASTRYGHTATHTAGGMGGMGGYPYHGMGGMAVRVVIGTRGMGCGMTILREGLVIILKLT